jgi:hypothetical protein
MYRKLTFLLMLVFRLSAGVQLTVGNFSFLACFEFIDFNKVRCIQNA